MKIAKNDTRFKGSGPLAPSSGIEKPLMKIIVFHLNPEGCLQIKPREMHRGVKVHAKDVENRRLFSVERTKKSLWRKRRFMEGDGMTGKLDSTKIMNNLHALIRSITE